MFTRDLSLTLTSSSCTNKMKCSQFMKIKYQQETHMELKDLILVSVDDHLIEPEDMFERHIRAAFKERAPKVVRGTGGAHHWVVEGQRAPGLGLNAVAGRPKEEYGF